MKKQNKKRKSRKNIRSKNNKVLKRIICGQSILILVLILSFVLYALNTKSEIKNMEKDKDQAVEEVKTKQGKNYVFLGDSITDWYPFSEFFDRSIPIINSGFAGYNTKKLLNHDLYDAVYRYNPTKVFIQIGTNDIGNNESSVDEAYDNIVKLINDIQENRPYAEIYIESIYPVNQACEKTVKSTTGERDNADIISLNDKLRTYCKENEIKYIDMYKELVDENGNLKSEYTLDGLHLSTEGYSKVSDVLKNYIEEN